VKFPSLLLITAAFLAGCSAKAPAMKRLLHDPPIDLRYLHDVFVPSYDAASRAKLLNSIAQLETHLAEFQAFMRDVETGKIVVRQSLKGDWGSHLDKPDGWLHATYASKLGLVVDFQKHQRKNPFPMIYGFTFNASGYIERADMPLDGFDFDDQGRLQQWYGPK
jgi:hypothetical protein